MSTDVKLITAAEFAGMKLDGRYELVRGELVEMVRPKPRHGVICKNIVFLLETWVRNGAGGIVFGNDAGIITERDPDSVRGPDVFYVAKDRWPADASLDDWLEFPPDLAVEVRSPSDRWNAIVAKALEYLAAGIAEVWIVEPHGRRVHVYRQDDEPFILGEQDDLTGGVLPDFRCKVAELFKDA